MTSVMKGWKGNRKLPIEQEQAKRQEDNTLPINLALLASTAIVVLVTSNDTMLCGKPRGNTTTNNTFEASFV